MKHWTEDDFQRWLYGLKDEDAHAGECAECRAELERLRVVRRRMVAPPEVSADFLAAQRRNIYNRLGERRRSTAALRWAIPVVMALAMVLSFTLLRSSKPTPLATPADEKLFSELAAIEQDAEPQAIAPMHKLFEE